MKTPEQIKQEDLEFLSEWLEPDPSGVGRRIAVDNTQNTVYLIAVLLSALNDSKRELSLKDAAHEVDLANRSKK